MKPNEDEEVTLATLAIADLEEPWARQALYWLIDSRRLWRERALAAEERLLVEHGDDTLRCDT